MAGFIFSAAFVFFCVAFFVASLVSITFIHALFYCLRHLHRLGGGGAFAQA